jgi:hypothetical protein
LDTGESFTGDLYPENLLTEQDYEQKKSWIKLKQSGSKEIFPAHGNPYKLRE